MRVERQMEKIAEPRRSREQQHELHAPEDSLEVLAGPAKGRSVTASASESEVDAVSETEAATEGSEK